MRYELENEDLNFLFKICDNQFNFGDMKLKIACRLNYEIITYLNFSYLIDTNS